MKPEETDMNYPKENRIIDAAFTAAHAATAVAVRRADGEDWGACGFAWVDIRPATSRLVRAMREREIGRRHWKSGWTVWNPGGWADQSIAIKEVGADAFAKVLLDHGFNAHAGSRVD